MDTAIVSDWVPFFTAQLGAAAALGGLVFVGLSINLDKIIATPTLPNRALLALAILLLALMTSSYVMIPQPLDALGWEVLCTSVSFAAFAVVVEMRTLRRVTSHRISFIINVGFLAASLVPYIIGGLLLIALNPAGLYFLAAAIVLSFVKAIVEAWVLLVEINR